VYNVTHTLTQQENDMMVQCKKTGRWYDPMVEFRKLMQQPEVLAVFIRLRDK